jgi:hypothetical protein
VRTGCLPTDVTVPQAIRLLYQREHLSIVISVTSVEYHEVICLCVRYCSKLHG